jgi:hypothetical protein
VVSLCPLIFCLHFLFLVQVNYVANTYFVYLFSIIFVYHPSKHFVNSFIYFSISLLAFASLPHICNTQFGIEFYLTHNFSLDIFRIKLDFLAIFLGLTWFLNTHLYPNLLFNVFERIILLRTCILANHFCRLFVASLFCTCFWSI